MTRLFAWTLGHEAGNGRSRCELQGPPPRYIRAPPPWQKLHPSGSVHKPVPIVSLVMRYPSEVLYSFIQHLNLQTISFRANWQELETTPTNHPGNSLETTRKEGLLGEGAHHQKPVWPLM